jgi:hypothetical protein
MAEIGAVASIITLVEATSTLVRVSRDLFLRWRDAPEEIQALARRLSFLDAELQSIQSAITNSHPLLSNAIIRQSIEELVTDLLERLQKLQTLHSRLDQHGKLRQKTKWTVKDAAAVTKMLCKIQEVEQRIANLMVLAVM